MSDSEFPVVIGVGASAGGVQALIELVAALPAGFGAPLLVVLHLAPSGTSVLADILDRRSNLLVTTASEGERLRAGRIYVAPPDQHLRLHDGALHLDREPRVNGHRPAVDPLLRSIARTYGADGVAAILSGTRDDGTLGAQAIKAAGGRVFVQDPDEALYASMPASALRAVDVDGCLPLAELAARLTQIAAEPPANPGRVAAGGEEDRNHRATRFTCPDCGGVIFYEEVEGTERYACSVGHEYSPESFSDEQARHLESALWAAVRSLEDRAVLLGNMAERAEVAGNRALARRRRSEQAESLQRADTIRGVIARPGQAREPA